MQTYYDQNNSVKNCWLLPVIEQIFDGHSSMISKQTMVNNPISSFPYNIVLSKSICSLFKLPQRVPMAPPQMGNLGRRLAAGPSFTRPGTRTRSHWVGYPVTLSNLNVDTLVLIRGGLRNRASHGWWGKELRASGRVDLDFSRNVGDDWINLVGY